MLAFSHTPTLSLLIYLPVSKIHPASFFCSASLEANPCYCTSQAPLTTSCCVCQWKALGRDWKIKDWRVKGAEKARSLSPSFFHSFPLSLPPFLSPFLIWMVFPIQKDGKDVDMQGRGGRAFSMKIVAKINSAKGK